MLALAAVALPGLVQKIADHSNNPFTVGVENTYITHRAGHPGAAGRAGAVGPGAAALAAAAGDDELTQWPWITHRVAGLVILNPIGLAFLRTR